MSNGFERQVHDEMLVLASVSLRASRQRAGTLSLLPNKHSGKALNSALPSACGKSLYAEEASYGYQIRQTNE
jgi:hypothetical protein